MTSRPFAFALVLLTLSTGALLTSFTVIVIVSRSSNLGVPLSVALTVTV